MTTRRTIQTDDDERSGLEPMLGGDLRETTGRVIFDRGLDFDETPPGLLEQALVFIETNF